MTPLTDRSGRFSPLKALVLTALLLPLGDLLRRWALGDLGPLPIQEALLTTGDWTIRFLVTGLALTPLQRIFAWPRLALVRRMTGLAGFSYGALHFSLYLAKLKFDLAMAASEIALRVYLAIGFVALLGLLALALTSTDGAVRRLGARWKALHRLVYGIALLGLLHYLMQTKIDASLATLMAGLFLLLMAYRLMFRWRLAVTPWTLALAALAGGLATGLAEFAWYGLATGADPFRIAAANLMLAHGLRPAPLVALAGLAVALAAALGTHGRPGAFGPKRRGRAPLALTPEPY
jgi:sulfoxide reductase heme-binding subunit YedZ